MMHTTCVVLCIAWSVLHADPFAELIAHPDDPMALYNAGVAKFEGEHYADAAQLFEQAGKKISGAAGVYAWYNAGNAQVKASDKKRAIEAFQKVLDIDSKHAKAREKIEWLKKEQEQNKQDDQKDQNKNQQQDQQQSSDSSSGKDQKKDKQQNEQRQDDNSSEGAQKDQKQEQDGQPGDSSDRNPRNKNERDQDRKDTDQGANNNERDTREQQSEKQSDKSDDHANSQENNASQSTQQPQQGKPENKKMSQREQKIFEALEAREHDARQEAVKAQLMRQHDGDSHASRATW